MQPQLTAKIDKATRKQFPDGILGYGTDALRYAFYSLASTGRDIKFDIGRIEGYRNFCNKIWNASRYVLSHAEGHDLLSKRGEDSLADRWIKSRMESTLQVVDSAYAQYRFDLASQALYDFVWNEFCDWYLELSKPVLWDEDTNAMAALGTRQTLITVLEQSLRMLHPFMPYLTEEIWQSVSPFAGTQGDSIMLAPWPTYSAEQIDEESEGEIEWLKTIIIAIRTIRAEANIPPSTELTVLVSHASEQDKARLTRNTAYLAKLAKVSQLTALSPDAEPPPSLMALCGELEIRVPMAGVIDIEQELVRLDKEITKHESELARLEGKLNNKAFVERAPTEVVLAERQKQEQAASSIATLRRQRSQIEVLRSA
jgi:valyl-tRNA synthetase